MASAALSLWGGWIDHNLAQRRNRCPGQIRFGGGCTTTGVRELAPAYADSFFFAFWDFTVAGGFLTGAAFAA
jgi:hypothetical protein